MKVAFTVMGNPVPKARARKGKGNHWYTPDQTRAREQAVAWKAIEAVARVRPSGSWPKDARYRVTIELVFADHRRVDIDNCAKLALDACNPKRRPPFIWKDDMQIDELVIRRLGVDKIRPRLTMEVEVL